MIDFWKLSQEKGCDIHILAPVENESIMGLFISGSPHDIFPDIEPVVVRQPYESEESFDERLIDVITRQISRIEDHKKKVLQFTEDAVKHEVREGFCQEEHTAEVERYDTKDDC